MYVYVCIYNITRLGYLLKIYFGKDHFCKISKGGHQKKKKKKTSIINETANF